jgi:hypothetical protein
METEKITLTATYVNISEDKTNLVIQPINSRSVRIAFGNTKPADDTVHFMVVNNGNPWIYNFEVEVGSQCWARSANDQPNDIVVVRANYGSSYTGV